MKNQYAEELVKELPLGIELTPKNRKNIHRLFPVPSDFTILWASVEAFGGHPSGIVVTDRALVIKGTSAGVKAVNQGCESKNSDSKNANQKIRAIYQIILWEHFDINDFQIINGSNGEYTIEYAATKYPHFSQACLARELIKQAKAKAQSNRLARQAAVDAAQADVLGFEKTVFASQYGAGTGITGHGIYAEEAGAILDRLNREKAEVVGRDNAKNGPDKNVNGIPVQCKYCKSPNSSMANCFKTNAAGAKEYRYYDLSGKPMKIEVPKEQYARAVEIMKKHILDGQVPGVTDPNTASDLVRQGKLTYAQALNLAKAGTIESLTYDAATGAVNCSFTFGLSALAAFVFAVYQTKDYKKAAMQAAIVGLQTYGLSLATQVLAMQIARTGLQKTLIPPTDLITQKIGNKAVQNLINSVRNLSGQKPIYGASAQKSFAKALRANIIAQSISFAVFSIPDTIKIVRGKISGMEYTKNVSSLLASFCGTYASSAVVRFFVKVAAISPNPAVKTLVFVSSAACGTGAGILARKVITVFREDDATILNRILDAAVINTCIDYVFDEAEIDKFLKLLFKDSGIERKLQLSMKHLYSSKRQYLELQAVLDAAALAVARQRPALTKAQEPEEDALIEALADVIENVSGEEVD